jgi:cell volume regulation protein A
MSGVESFGLPVLIAAMVGLAAVLSSQVGQRLRVPAPAIFLLCAAMASDLWPGLGSLSVGSVERMVTVALAVILFDGGMHIGRRRLRIAAGATVWIGVVGTIATTAGLAVAAYVLFDLSWRTALLLGTALAPTDPAVVFSVLGRREVAGRTGVILEGESGVNDPVAIALMVALLAGGAASLHPGTVAAEFALQMGVGGAVGAVGGWALLVFMRRVSLPGEGLYPLRVLAGALAIYGLASVAHGSGFLAVFVAGILIGDERAPYKGEIERFHSALASLAEIIAFVLLGLTIRLRDLVDARVWLVGLLLAALLTFVIRPLVVGVLLWPVRLRAGERIFVLWTGLKGAVPILLGTFIVQAGVTEARRLYGIIFVAVAFSVIVQGGLVPYMARRLHVRLRAVKPEPWTLGVRFRDEPEGLHRLRVTSGAPADGCSIAELDLGEDAWISLVVRRGRLVPFRADTHLLSGDEVLLLAPPEAASGLRALFTAGREGGRGG